MSSISTTMRGSGGLPALYTDRCSAHARDRICRRRASSRSSITMWRLIASTSSPVATSTTFGSGRSIESPREAQSNARIATDSSSHDIEPTANAIDRRAVVLPAPPDPKIRHPPPRSRSTSTGPCCWDSGASNRPIAGIVPPGPTSSSVITDASGSCHGRRRRGSAAPCRRPRPQRARPAAASRRRIASSDPSNVGSSTSWARVVEVRDQRSAAIAPKTPPPARRYALWKATGCCEPIRTTPRPRIPAGMSAASALPITAVDSGRSSMRSEMRRFVLARMFSFDRPGRALRGEDEVDAEAAAALGDVDHAVDELRHLLHERGELVDDDHQRRRRLVRAPPRPSRRGPWPGPRAAASGGSARRAAT